MKITCDRSALADAFSLAASAAPTRTPREILLNVKMMANSEGVWFTGSDTEVSVVSLLSEGVEVEEAGSILLPVSRTNAVLRESNDDTITIESEVSGKITLRGRNGRHSFPSINPDEFPSVKKFDFEEWVDVPANAVVKGFARTVYATDSESSRYALGGVKIEEDNGDLVFIGTDGRRLATQRVSATNREHSVGENLLIPTKAVAMIQRATSKAHDMVRVHVSMNDVVIDTGASTIVSRLVEGRYPAWRQVVPSNIDEYKTATVEAGMLLQAVRQASIVTDMDSRGIDLTFKRNRLFIEANTAEVGESKIDLAIDYQGEDVSLTLDYRYLQDVCKVLDSEAVLTLQFLSSKSPLSISADDNYQVVVMPMARDR